MRRTPDPRTAKRERSMEEETPNNRQRTSSIEPESGTLFATPAGTPSAPDKGDSKLDWNKSVDDEERGSNVSNIIQMFDCSDIDCRTDGSENMDDQIINTMIQDNLNQRQDNGVPGVLPLEAVSDDNRRQDKFSNLLQKIVNVAIKEAVKPLMVEINILKQLIVKNNPTNLTKPDQTLDQTASRPIWPRIISPPTLPHIPKVCEREQAFNLARRSLGLYPISQDDLIRNTNKVEDSMDKSVKEQIGGANTARDYLCVVLGMKEEEANRLNIIKVFKQPGNSNTNVLFVEFTNENDVKNIKKMVGNMETGGDQRLLNFIPKILQKEYDAVAQRAFKGRNQVTKHASKIWISSKFELRLRPKGDYTPWSKITQENLDNEEPKLTGPIPKIVTKPTTTATAPTTTATHLPKHKPDFSNSNNPNFQVIGSGREKGTGWEGPNLLPQQTPTTNGYQILGEELMIRP